MQVSHDAIQHAFFIFRFDIDRRLFRSQPTGRRNVRSSFVGLIQGSNDVHLHQPLVRKARASIFSILDAVVKGIHHGTDFLVDVLISQYSHRLNRIMKRGLVHQLTLLHDVELHFRGKMDFHSILVLFPLFIQLRNDVSMEALQFRGVIGGWIGWFALPFLGNPFKNLGRSGQPI